MKKPTPYDHKKIEKKWQKVWNKNKVYKTSEISDREKYYVLDMFPYPSGEGLHVGHPKGYIATDVVSRMKRMQGHNVLHPMGFDAFGLPAENYAIKMKTNPQISVKKNVAHYKDQLEILGFDYDWSREINTTDPEYFRWTQWIFLQMLKKGLAYESYEPIDWCPKDKTGLAKEDIEDGKCERCGTPVEKKLLRQWVLKITDYAERMLVDLDLKDADGKYLIDWPQSIRESQKNWIGKSEGTEIDFLLNFKKNPKDNDNRGPNGEKATIKIFTTRPDTLFGVTYIVLSPEHPWVTLATDDNHEVIDNKQEIKDYVKNVSTKTEIERTSEGKEKTGVEIKGVKAINSATKEEIPMYVADYVLADYGTGAVMAVPFHDERDFDFATKFNLPMREVIIPRLVDSHDPPKEGVKTVERKAIQAIIIDPKTKKVLTLRWKKLPWTTFVTGGIEGDEDPVEAARREILEETGYKNLKFIRPLGGKIESHFYANHKGENRKALFTGLVFELENDERNEMSEEEKAIHELSWVTWDELAKDKNIKCSEYETYLDRLFSKPHAFTEDGVLQDSGEFSGLRSREAIEKISKKFGHTVIKYKLRDWVFARQRYWGEPIPVIHCDTCGTVPVPEKDLPVVLPKVKYYEPTGTGESPLAAIEKWVNVKCPNCKGKAKRETNTMPQWAGSSWYYLRFIDPKNKKSLIDPQKEKVMMPVDLYVGGAEHATRHLIYARFWHKFLYDIGVVSGLEPFKKLQHVGLIMAADGRKMSKRWGNVVNPDDVIALYGADTLRLYEMFMGPFDQMVSWSTEGIIGPRRFLERIWKMQHKVVKKLPFVADIETRIHKTIKKVSEDIENMQFNTAISSLMILVNFMDGYDQIAQSYFEHLLHLLAPFAPHITDEIWSNLGHKKSIHIEKWPQFDPSKMIESNVNIVIQINGKVRGEMTVAVEAKEDDVKNMALNMDITKKWLDGKPPKKVVYVRGRLISIVV